MFAESYTNANEVQNLHIVMILYAHVKVALVSPSSCPVTFISKQGSVTMLWAVHDVGLSICYSMQILTETIHAPT